jgi:hypothetical protein
VIKNKLLWSFLIVVALSLGASQATQAQTAWQIVAQTCPIDTPTAKAVGFSLQPDAPTEAGLTVCPRAFRLSVYPAASNSLRPCRLMF